MNRLKCDPNTEGLLLLLMMQSLHLSELCASFPQDLSSNHISKMIHRGMSMITVLSHTDTWIDHALIQKLSFWPSLGEQFQFAVWKFFQQWEIKSTRDNLVFIQTLHVLSSNLKNQDVFYMYFKLFSFIRVQTVYILLINSYC